MKALTRVRRLRGVPSLTDFHHVCAVAEEGSDELLANVAAELEALLVRVTHDVAREKDSSGASTLRDPVSRLQRGPAPMLRARGAGGSGRSRTTGGGSKRRKTTVTGQAAAPPRTTTGGSEAPAPEADPLEGFEFIKELVKYKYSRTASSKRIAVEEHVRVGTCPLPCAGTGVP